MPVLRRTHPNPTGGRSPAIPDPTGQATRGTAAEIAGETAGGRVGGEGVHDRDHRPREPLKPPPCAPPAGAGREMVSMAAIRTPISSAPGATLLSGRCTVLVVPVADVVGESLPGAARTSKDEHRPGHPAHPGQPVQHQIRIRWPGQAARTSSTLGTPWGRGDPTGQPQQRPLAPPSPARSATDAAMARATTSPRPRPRTCGRRGWCAGEVSPSRPPRSGRDSRCDRAEVDQRPRV